MFSKYVAKQIDDSIKLYESRKLQDKNDQYKDKLVINIYADELAVSKHAELNYLHNYCSSLDAEKVYYAAKAFVESWREKIAKELVDELDLTDEDLIYEFHECDKRFKENFYQIPHHRFLIPALHVEQLKKILANQNIHISRSISALG